MSPQITAVEVSQYIAQEAPKTFEVFDDARAKGKEAVQYWARGRVDAMLQILQWIDQGEAERLQSLWDARFDQAHADEDEL